MAGFDDADDLGVLDLLDALVRKSLLVADRSSGRTRFSMLETIRQFAEEHLVASGAAEEVRAAHAGYYAGREADIMAHWDSPASARPTSGSLSNWPICAPLRTVDSLLCALSSHAAWTPTCMSRLNLVIGLTITDSHDEAMAAANGLIDAAEAAGNPFVLPV